MADGVLLVAVLFCFSLGLPMARWPHEMARLNEIIDAIGRKPAGPVEPADWQVSLTRFLGIGLSVAGTLLLLGLFI